jgi:N-acetylglutamate synthase-like GNAT family acetyltransferase
MEIRPAHESDAPVLAMLISKSNTDVALQFGITAENCPKHPSFCRPEWLANDFARGEMYFIAYEAEEPIACVATEYPSPEIAYLNRLAVLPAHRTKGVGTSLVKFVLERARALGTKTVSIGVIGEHAALQEWYRGFGFVSGETKHFPHLPFSVKYMAHALTDA